MIVQVVTLEVKPDRRDEFLIEAISNVRSSQKETGVVQFELLQEFDSPNKFMLYEVYQSGEDINTHRETPHYNRWVECGIPLLLGERIRTVYNLIIT